MRATRIATALLAVGLVRPASAAEPVATHPLARHIPAESLLFVGYDGKNQACRGTAVFKIAAEPEVKAAFGPPLAALERLVAAKVRKSGGPDLAALRPLLGTRVGFAFLGLSPPAAEGMEPQPELLFVAEVGKPDSAESKAVGLLLDFLLRKAGLGPDAFKAATIGGLRGHRTDFGHTTLSYVTTKGLLALGTGEAVAKALDANTSKLSGSKEFQRATRETGGNELLIAYYAHGAVLLRFGMFLPPKAARFLLNRPFGLANVKSLTFALAPNGRELKGTVFVCAPGQRTGVLKLLGGRPLSPDIAKFAPERAALFYATSLDAAAAWDFVVAHAARTPGAQRRLQERLTRLNEQLGFDLRADLLGSLGDELAVFSPEPTVVVKLRDPAKFKKCVEAALPFLADLFKEQFRRLDDDAVLKLATTTHQGRTITYVDGEGFPLLVQPSYTLVGDYAVIAAYPTKLKAFIARPPDARTLLDKADFGTARLQLQRGATSLYYADLRASWADLHDGLSALAGAFRVLPPAARKLCPDPAALPAPAVISKHLFGTSAVCRTLDDGVVWECRSALGVPTPLPVFSQGARAIIKPAVYFGILKEPIGELRRKFRRKPPAPPPPPRGLRDF